MKTSHLFKLLTVAILIGSYGCSAVYHPNMVYTPLLSNKKELKIGASLNNAQCAYAITNHIGIMAKANYIKQTDSYNLKVGHYLFEGGAGYFGNIDEWALEAYGGYGIGQSLTKLSYQNTGSYVGNYIGVDLRRAFIQTTVAYTSPYADIAFSTRLSHVFVNEQFSTRTSNGFFIEPTLTAKVGYKYVKLVMQTGLSLGQFSDSRYSGYPLIGYLGLEADLWHHYKDKKAPTNSF